MIKFWRSGLGNLLRQFCAECGGHIANGFWRESCQRLPASMSASLRMNGKPGFSGFDEGVLRFRLPRSHIV